MTAWFSSRLKAHLIARCLNLGDFLPLQALVRNSAVHIPGISSNIGLIDSGSGAGMTGRVGRPGGRNHRRRYFALIKTRCLQSRPKGNSHHPISSKHYYLLPALQSSFPASTVATPSSIDPSYLFARCPYLEGHFLLLYWVDPEGAKYWRNGRPAHTPSSVLPLSNSISCCWSGACADFGGSIATLANGKRAPNNMTTRY